MAHFLPAYRPGLRVREAAHPKLFWVDAGIARAVAGLLRDPLDRIWKGTSLETLIYHDSSPDRFPHEEAEETAHSSFIGSSRGRRRCITARAAR